MEHCKEWVEEGNVMLLPSSLYDFGDSHFRLGLGRVDAKEVLGLWEKHLVKKSPSSMTLVTEKPNVFVCRKCGNTLFTVSDLCGEDMHEITKDCESYFLGNELVQMKI